MKGHIRQFIYLLDGKAKKGIPLLFFLFTVSSIVEVIGVGLIGVFLGVITNPQFFLSKLPSAFGFLQDLSEKNLIVFVGILIILAFISKAIISLFIQNRIINFCQSFSVRLKTRMMSYYQYAPYIYHLNKNSAHLIARIQDNINNYIGNVVLPILNLFTAGLVAISILVLLSMMHPFITIFLVIMFALIGIFFDLVVKKKLSALGKIVAFSSGDLIKSIHQGLHGLTEIRVLGREKFFIESLSNISENYSKAAGVLVAMQQIPKYLIENLIAIFIVTLSIGGLMSGYNNGTILALVGMFAAAGARLLPIVTQIMSSSNQVRSYHHHMKVIYDEFSELDTLRESTKIQLIAKEESKLSFNRVELKNISYQYPNNQLLALENINLNFNKGQSVGVIGPSGAGKSTLINLILGFLEPQDGELLIDGKPIANLRAWLNNCAYIPQTIFLLDDDLRHNIAFGIEDKDIDEQRLWQTIKMAQLMEVVERLPNGLQTLIGENGVRLSGGQRQRVALARALYHERDIIIMDEATSSLDHETEKEVINTIKHLKGNKTLIVIAHRLTTIEHCDILYKIDKGCITSTGSFKEVVGQVF